MANEINFYQSTAEIPSNIQNGAVYFILNQTKDIATIKVDLNNKRYTVNPNISIVTDSVDGLMTSVDKKKIDTILIDNSENSDVININGKDNKGFNFLNNLTINNKRILTESTLKSVDVVPIGPDDPVQPNEIEIVPLEDGNFGMKLWLNIPTGPQGPQGIQGVRGKASRINGTIGTVIEDDTIEGSVVQIVPTTIEDENEFVTDLVFNFKNLKGETGGEGPQGPQGIQGEHGTIGNIKFRFIAGSPESDGTILNSETDYEYDAESNSYVKIYTVVVPRGFKGDSGKNLEVEYFFDSKENMRQAVQNHEVESNSYIMLQRTDIDPANGEIWYKGSNEPSQSSSASDLDLDLRLITDIAPTQPEFSVESNVSVIPWNQTGQVTIDNTQGADKPKLSFTLPRGKPMDFGTVSATIDKKYGEPQVIVTPTNIDSGSDTRQQNLAFDFKNMGVAIDSAEGTVDNTVGNPNVTITPSVYDNNTKQKLFFNFSGIKGEQGEVGPMPELKPQVTLNISAGDPSQNPTGTASWTEENNQKVLNLSLTNLKGQDGNIANLYTQGTGNGVSDLTYVNQNLTVIKTQFATETYAANPDNLSSSVKVTKGGTGLNSFTNNNSILINKKEEDLNNSGTYNYSMSELQSNTGALYSTGQNVAPQFGILPSSLGGTGLQTPAQNAVLVGDNSIAIKTIASNSGAFYSTGSNIAPQFGILPVGQGGTGVASFVTNQILVGDGTNSVKQIDKVEVKLGGTGLTNFTNNNSILINKKIANSQNVGVYNYSMAEIQSTAGAFYSTGTNEQPQFGTLPVAQGGTGATTAEQARINLGTMSGYIGHPNTTNTSYYREQVIPTVDSQTHEITFDDTNPVKDFCLKIDYVSYYAESIPQNISGNSVDNGEEPEQIEEP